MKCPKRFREMVPVDAEERYLGGDCLEAMCAWWEEEHKVCAVKLIPGWLASIAGVLCEKKVRKLKGLKL